MDRVSVASAGLRADEGQPSPDDAVRAASEFGVDLSEHRSKPATEELVRWSDAVLLMDVYNYRHFRQDFGDQADKAFFLGAFADGEYEIIDPHGDDLAKYRAVYDDVVRSVDGFVTALETDR